MSLFFLVAAFGVLAVISYWGANTFLKARISRELMAHEAPFRIESFDYGKTLLVLGDSTGAGVGAERPEDSVAGRLATYIGATYVENYASSGTAVAELVEQFKQAKLPEYHYILIQIGGNDIIAFHPAKETAQKLSVFLGSLPEKAKILLMSAGNVGGATIFPPPFRPFHTLTNLAYHKEFSLVAHGWGVTYVNLFEPFWKDPFLRDPARYLSRDGLHPSSYGYGLWFEKLKAVLK